MGRRGHGGPPERPQRRLAPIQAVPTHDETGTFLRDYESLTPQHQDRFDGKREEFVADRIAMDQRRRQGFRPTRTA